MQTKHMTKARVWWNGGLTHDFETLNEVKCPLLGTIVLPCF